VSDELGPRWRRAATLTEPGSFVMPAVEIEPAPRSELSGIYSVVLPPIEPPAVEPEPEPEPVAPPARRLRPRVLALALAGALLLAVATIMYSTAPGDEPRAAQLPPAGPSLETRLREAVAPALRADARLSKELSSLVPGASPARALDRVAAALPATRTALTAVRELPAVDDRVLHDRATRALRTQTDYLEVVRDALRLQTDAEQLDALGGLSARLVSRLERIETAVPRASESVGGARLLKQWVLAELPATHAPAPAPAPTFPAAPAPPQPEPTPIATATPTPTTTPQATPTPGTPDEAHTFHGRPRLQPRRARLRNRFETRAREPRVAG
jgi:hypothetical protein